MSPAAVRNILHGRPFPPRVIAFLHRSLPFPITAANHPKRLILVVVPEFAFVVFKLAKDLGVLPDELGKLLTASVIISMSLTPLLGEVAGWVADRIEDAEGSAPEGKRLRAAETTAATAAATPPETPNQ